jgi:hypothetical protein
MRNKTYKIVVWVTLLSQLALGLGGPVEAFLCIGQDGHVDIEFGPADCCGPKPAETTKDTCPIDGDACQIDQDQLCGDCVDIPLLIAGQDHPVTARQNHAEPTNQISVSLIDLSDSGHSAVSNRNALDSRPVQEAVDNILRATVLQI